MELPDGEPFANCYFFEEDGTWIDPPFPGGPGTWVQHTNGASTTYTAVAEGEWFPGVYLVLEQNGAVTPAQGSGVLQLEATTIVDVLVGGEVVAEVEFYSVGFQNNDCSRERPRAAFPGSSGIGEMLRDEPAFRELRCSIH